MEITPECDVAPCRHAPPLQSARARNATLVAVVLPYPHAEVGLRLPVRAPCLELVGVTQVDPRPVPHVALSHTDRAAPPSARWTTPCHAHTPRESHRAHVLIAGEALAVKHFSPTRSLPIKAHPLPSLTREPAQLPPPLEAAQ
jgi:hypothetical protein